MIGRKSRTYTNRILGLIEEGLLDETEVLTQCLMWMSEHEVQEMYEKVYADEFEEEEEEA